MPKRKRVSRVLEEKHILKSAEAGPITTPTLENGGKVNPAGMPIGGFVDPEDIKEKKRKELEKQIKPNPKNLFFYIRLPDDIRKNLTALSRVVAADTTGVEVEDVDHITLFFVRSKEGEFDAEVAENVRTVAQEVIKDSLPLEGYFQGWAYFDQAERHGEKKTALVALLDVPGLESVYVNLKEALENAGIDYEQKHSYVPHATLAYLPLGARVSTKLPLANDKVTITEAEMMHEKSHVLKEVISPAAEPGTMEIDRLRQTHWDLHMLFRDATGETIEGFTIQQLVNLHARTVDELYQRNVPHPPPPDDGLDDNSSSFESSASEQPDWTVPIQKSAHYMLIAGFEEKQFFDEREKVYFESGLKDLQED